MKRKALLTTLIILITGGFVGVNSQTNYYSSQVDSSNEGIDPSSVSANQNYNTYKTTWKKNRFKDTWFITLGSGAQLLMAEDDDKGSFGSRITYAPTFTIGKYFSPIWGLRFNFTGGSLHGFNDGRDGTYRKWNKGSKNYLGKGYADKLGMTNVSPGTAFTTWDPSWVQRGFSTDATDRSKQIAYDGDNKTYSWVPGLFGEGLYMQHVKYMAVNINFMFDFFTLVGDYKPNRFFEITPFGGATYAHLFPTYGDGAYDTFGVNGGLNFRFRLSDKFNFNVEAAATLYPDEFDGHMGGARSFDAVTQLTAGITYKLGKSTWEVAEPMNYKMIQDLNDRINYLKLELENSKKPCPTCPPCPTPVEPQKTESETTIFLPDPVFFRIDKSVIDAGEWSKIEKCVDYLQRNPDANVVVTGYADRKTAYPEYNMRLSERRAKTVSKALIDKYGVNPLKISINWEGDRIQPFEINEWNRVVIFVIE